MKKVYNHFANISAYFRRTASPGTSDRPSRRLRRKAVRKAWTLRALKNDELLKEKERSDRLASALRAWHAATIEGTCSRAAMQLVDVLRETKIVER